MSTRDHVDGRQNILDHAQRLFLARGYHGVSIRDIARACGFTNAALYHHFGSKQDLFIQVFRAYVAKLLHLLEKAASGEGSCRERLLRVATAYTRQIVAAHIESQILARDLAAFKSEEARMLTHEAEGRIPSIFARVLVDGMAVGEIRAVDAELVSVMLHGMLNGMTIRNMFNTGPSTLTEEIDLAIHTLFEGIGA